MEGKFVGGAAKVERSIEAGEFEQLVAKLKE